MDIGELHLCRRDEVHAFAGFEQVVFELRKLAGAGKRGGIGHSRAPPFLVTTGNMRVGHEVDESTLKASAQAAQQHKTATCELYGTLSIDDAKLCAQVPMGLHFEAFGLEVARGAPATNLGVVVFVLTNRGGISRHVRRGHEHIAQAFVGCSAFGAELSDLILELGNLGLCSLCFFLLAFTHQLADGLGDGVALCLKLFFLSN